MVRALDPVETQNLAQKRVYSLAQTGLALWLIEAIDFIAHRLGRASADDIAPATLLWRAEAAETVI